jgi:hypothetical protein
MLQEILIVLIFIAALAYLGRLVFRSFQANSCATGCGKCSAVDFSKIEKQLGQNKLQ